MRAGRPADELPLRYRWRNLPELQLADATNGLLQQHLHEHLRPIQLFGWLLPRKSVRSEVVAVEQRVRQQRLDLPELRSG